MTQFGGSILLMLFKASNCQFIPVPVIKLYNGRSLKPMVIIHGIAAKDELSNSPPYSLYSHNVFDEVGPPN